MSQPVAIPGQIVDLHLAKPSAENRLTVLVKTPDVEIIQLSIPAGSKIPTYEAEGEIILQCLEGRVALTVLGEFHELKAGQLLYLAQNEPFSMQGLERASVLTTIIARKQGPNVELIGKHIPGR